MNKKSFWVLITFILIVIISLLLGSTSTALFTSSAVSNKNVFTAGTVEIHLDRNDRMPYFDLENLAPGETGSSLIRITNSGSLEMAYQISYTLVGRLAEGSHPLNIQFSSLTGQVINLSENRYLAAGAFEELLISWLLPLAAGNEYQAGNARLDLLVNASQAINDSESENSLSASFYQNSDEIIERLHQHYQDNGNFSRSWGDYAYTDIGLDPADWSSPVNQVYYKPGGSWLRVRPANGYQILGQGINGETYVLTHHLNWNLWYDLVSQAWYFHSIQPGNEIVTATILLTSTDK